MLWNVVVPSFRQQHKLVLKGFLVCGLGMKNGNTLLLWDELFGWKWIGQRSA